jgi:hypothetical protein
LKNNEQGLDSGATDDPASLQALAAKIQSLEPAMLAAAPAALKPTLQDIFAFDTSFFQELAKAGYSYAKIPASFLKTLQAEEPKLEAESKSIETYITHTCGISETTGATTGTT